jgi:hypothetical protein
MNTQEIIAQLSQMAPEDRAAVLNAMAPAKPVAKISYLDHAKAIFKTFPHIKTIFVNEVTGAWTYAAKVGHNLALTRENIGPKLEAQAESLF